MSLRQDWLLLKAANKEFAFVDEFLSKRSSDFTYFGLINDIVQKEPADALDPKIAGSLAAIGIVKGQPFKPGARVKRF